MSECIKSQFSSFATGITRYGLGYKHIKNISVCLPPLETWDTDGWGGYNRVLPPEVKHYIGKERTQRLERTNFFTLL